MTAQPSVRAFRSAPADPHSRGAHFGRVNAAHIHRTLAAYRDLWHVFGVGEDDVGEVGEAVQEPVREFSPSLHAELAGVAHGAGLATWEVAALNARTELLARGDAWLGECTTCVRVPADGGPPTTAQTWDWHAELAESWFVWTLEHPDGRVVHTLTEYGILGKIGVSSAGISVHFNALRHRLDTGGGGVPVHLVARRILDEASDIEQAVRIAEQAQVSASASITVTGPRGLRYGAVAIELHPGGPAIVPAPQHAEEYLLHTNHFLGGVSPGDQVIRPRATTHDRLNQAVGAVEQRRPADAAGLVSLLAQHCSLGQTCVHLDPLLPHGERVATLAVVATEPAKGVISVRSGAPCRASAALVPSAVGTKPVHLP